MNRSLLAAAVSIPSIALLVSTFVACDDDPRYVYTAQRYDEAAGCLEEYSAIEVVPGDSVSVRCPPACLSVGDDLYVSPVCPPLPDNAVAVDPSDPTCAAALEAARSATLCDAPEEEQDGGEIAPDAAEDAVVEDAPDAPDAPDATPPGPDADVTDAADGG
jgi:hypothetical protein